MISKVTVNNSEALKGRLKDISTALGKQINNLEEYYANIVEISKLSTTRSDPYKYFLMPLDEPLFEIDADKRTINVPAHFAKNGVGVYGDHMAEVLYFRVDRYFDYQDLYNVDDIIINWQFRPASMSRNAKLETHTSKALAPDETYDPGYVVFGWVIGNYTPEIDEEGNESIAYMTPGKGVLTFSVSFIKRSEDHQDFEYVLNTQAVSVNIQDSLVLDKPIKLDSINKPLFKKMMNSTYSIDGITPPMTPIFLSGEENNDGDGISRWSGLNSSANFNISASGEENKLVLSALAGTLDDTSNTSIEYCWAGTDHDGKKLNEEEEWKQSEFLESMDLEYINGKMYYIEAQNEIGYEMINAERFAAIRNSEDDDTIIYESGSTQDIVKGGSYTVSIRSQKTVKSVDEEGVEHIAVVPSLSTESKACFIPRAAVPEIELFIPQENDIFDEEEAFKDQLLKINDKDRQDKQSDGSLIQYVYFDQEVSGSEPPAIKAHVDIDTDKIEKSTLEGENYVITGEPGVTKDSSLGFIKFYLTSQGESGKPVENIYTNVSEGHGAYVANQEKLPFDLEVGSEASGDGEWQAYAVNERNHTFSISDISNKIYVSKVAPSLKINLSFAGVNVNGAENEVRTPLIVDNVIVEDEAHNPLYDLIDKPVTINATMSSMRFYCEVTAPANAPEDFSSNFELVELDADLQPIASGDEPNRYTLNEQGAFELAEGGYFCVKATTVYHGTKRTTLSQPFFVSTFFNG